MSPARFGPIKEKYLQKLSGIPTGSVISLPSELKIKFSLGLDFFRLKTLPTVNTDKTLGPN